MARSNSRTGVSAGLDYAAVGPEHAWLRDQNRVEYTYAKMTKALEAFMKLARWKASFPRWKAPTPSPKCIKRAPKMSEDQLIIINLSGRGDKDVAQAARLVGLA